MFQPSPLLRAWHRFFCRLFPNSKISPPFFDELDDHQSSLIPNFLTILPYLPTSILTKFANCSGVL